MPRSIDKKSGTPSISDEAEIDGVPDQIRDTIVSAILDRALDPGTKLPEDVFCSHYGVSRTIVRVAIHRLEYDKLVEIQRNRGCFVVVPSLAEAVDILGGRKAIEPSIIRRVSEVRTDTDLAQLHAHVDMEDQAYRNDDHRAALRLSGQFHLMLGGIANISCVNSFLHNLICRSALVIATYSDVAGCCKAHDHRRLVELLTSNDAEEAARQMASHLDHIERDLLQVREAQEKPSLESVLARYTKGGTRALKTGRLRLIEPSPKTTS